MDNETKFEQWRTAVLKGTPCPPSLRNWVWNEAMKAVKALARKRAIGLTNKMGREERGEFYTDLCLMFLEYLKDRADKPIGWCFKSFRLLFPDVLTRLEAKRLGIGLKPNPYIKNYETRTLRAALAKGRGGEVVHPVVNSLQVGSIPFDERDIEYIEDGSVILLDRFV